MTRFFVKVSTKEVINRLRIAADKLGYKWSSYCEGVVSEYLHTNCYVMQSEGPRHKLEKKFPFYGTVTDWFGLMGSEPARQTSEPGSNPSWDAAVHPVCETFNVMHVV